MNFQALVRARHSVRAYKPDAGRGRRSWPASSRRRAWPRPRPTVSRSASSSCRPKAARPSSAASTRASGSARRRLSWPSARSRPRAGSAKHDGWNAAEVDASIAMSHIVLAAAEEGLGHVLDRRVRSGGGPGGAGPAAGRSSPRPSRPWGTRPTAADAEEAAAPGGARPARPLVRAGARRRAEPFGPALTRGVNVQERHRRRAEDGDLRHDVQALEPLRSRRHHQSHRHRPTVRWRRVVRDKGVGRGPAHALVPMDLPPQGARWT